MISGFLGHNIRLTFEKDGARGVGKGLITKDKMLLVQIIEGPCPSTGLVKATTFAGGLRLTMRANIYGEMTGRVVLCPIGSITAVPVPDDLKPVVQVITAVTSIHGEPVNLEVMAGGSDSLYFSADKPLDFEGSVPLQIVAGHSQLDVSSELLSQGLTDEAYCGVLAIQFTDRIGPARWKTMCA